LYSTGQNPAAPWEAIREMTKQAADRVSEHVEHLLTAVFGIARHAT